MNTPLLTRALARGPDAAVGKRVTFLHAHPGVIVMQLGEDIVLKLDELPDEGKYLVATHISTVTFLCDVVPHVDDDPEFRQRSLDAYRIGGRP